MVKILLGLGIADMSGSIAGTTFAHNRAGAYARNKVIPVNGNSARQDAVRAEFATESADWRDLLTSEQRDGWSTFGKNSPMKDTLGRTFYPTGLNAFQQVNSRLAQMGETKLVDAPATFGLCNPIIPVMSGFAISAADQELEITVATNLGGFEASTVDDRVMISLSAGYPQSKNFFKGPYRYAGKVVGAVVPPTFPLTIACPFTVAVGQKVFMKIIHISADGNPSTETTDTITVVA